MPERTLTIGAEAQLVGVYVEPDRELAEPKPLVLLLNAGLVHHVGPNRLYVELSRALARHGFPSLRFDLSGIGDSGRAAEDREYQEQAVIDIVEAMDHMVETEGRRDFVLAGLCTGAYNAMAAAVQDRRVAGTILIDGHAYATTRYLVVDKLKRVSQGWRWRRYIKRKLGRGEPPRQASPYDAMVFEPDDLSQGEYARRMKNLVERGTQVFLVFTGHGPQPYNYQSQFSDSFPEFDDSGIEVMYMPDSTHTFTSRDHRDQLAAALTQWMTSRFEARGDSLPPSGRD